MVGSTFPNWCRWLQHDCGVFYYQDPEAKKVLGLRELRAGHIGTQNFQIGAYDQQGNCNALSGLGKRVDHKEVTNKKQECLAIGSAHELESQYRSWGVIFST